MPPRWDKTLKYWSWIQAMPAHLVWDHGLNTLLAALRSIGGKVIVFGSWHRKVN